jgi:large subunit ribosomal protein L4
MEGQEVGKMELSDAVFGVEINEHLVHMAVVQQLANNRQGTQKAKTRSEVSGGGKKPYRQKGTGRARQGSIRAAQWTGGGVVFGPVPRSYAKKANNKVKKLAMRSALSAKLADAELVLLDALSFDEPSTKRAAAVIKALGLTGKRVTLVVDDEAVVEYLSFRNIPKVEVIAVSEANTRNLIDNAALVMSVDVAKTLEEALA